MSGLFSAQPRFNGFRPSPNLPVLSSAVQEKMNRSAHSVSWTLHALVPIPGVRNRRLRLLLPNVPRMYRVSASRFGRRRRLFVIFILVVSIFFTVFALNGRLGSAKQWPIPIPMNLVIRDPPTLVYEREDLQRIWKWEIESGHYPSSRDLPKLINFTVPPLNPALPPKGGMSPMRPIPAGEYVSHTVGYGPKRVYLDIQACPPGVAYPPRPVPGSVADMDVVMDHCDFATQKYVRDCLEVLRLGGGLDNENRLRRGTMNDWKYIYLEDGDVDTSVKSVSASVLSVGPQDPNNRLPKKPRVEYEPHLKLPPPVLHRSYHSLPSTCDPDNPRLFHIFWTGPFTDKPYLALLSFLFTQNVRLHLHEDDPDATVCRPKLWMWISPGPAAAVLKPNAMHDMFEQLKSSPWASPFLHPRFKDVISFRLWNRTEQLDNIPEIKDDWRILQDSLFNSGGHIIRIPKGQEKEKNEDSENADAGKPKEEENNLLNRLGSKSESSYDRISVIMSDMARFVLCHRFGGVYLDADTIFLRDWEELWGWKGAFAYRWERWEKYNTAVLRMHKNSALGTFLFRTAFKNGLDFHPMKVSRYIKDAALDGLLLRLPDALFDSAWLNTENFQRDRPPQPYLQKFADFFDTPAQDSAAPAALGFEGFYRGAYSYHFHNGWWRPLDPTRNWPDLGPKFIDGERQARGLGPTDELPVDRVADDKRDLDWATVLKRTFESYIRGERPNMYGEWLQW